jgi:hypothetical protein
MRRRSPRPTPPTPITPGAPREVYTPNTAFDADALLTVDLDAVEVLAMVRADQHGLRAFTSIADDEPTEAQLWPEHFDLRYRPTRSTCGHDDRTTCPPVCRSLRKGDRAPDPF